MLRAFLMAVWVLTGASAFAQQDEESLPTSSDELSVEVLVFAFPSGGEGAELASGTHFEILGGTSIEASGTGRYVELEAQARKLAPAFTRLSASSETKPLLFTAWRQGLSDQQWVTLKASRAGELVGRVLLKPGKPLSVRVELNFRSSDDRMFRVRSTRPAHFNETLYFDHPAFGALVRIGEPGAP